MLPPAPQLEHQGGVERHVPPAVLRLRRLDLAADDRPPDSHPRRGAIELEIRPPERDELGPADAGGNQEPEHQPMTRPDDGEEGAQLLPRERTHRTLVVRLLVDVILDRLQAGRQYRTVSPGYGGSGRVGARSPSRPGPARRCAGRFRPRAPPAPPPRLACPSRRRYGVPVRRHRSQAIQSAMSVGVTFASWRPPR
jgi:hypothetical protein